MPTASDDVTISLSGNPTIQISSGTQSVNSLTATDPLSISGGSLAVAATSTISGGLSMTGGSLAASGSGVSLTVTGTITVSGASLYAQAGASLSFTQLISYSNPNSYDDTYFEATGAGAVLSLPALASLAPLQSYLHFQATQGGQVKAPALTSIGNPSQQAEYLQVYADGTGSEVDISGLTSLVVSTGSLTVTNQATVLDAGLTTLNGTSVTLDGTGTLAISQWTTLTSSSLTITAGSYTFPGLTDIDGSSLYA
ncbi:MAG: hypothetical protein WA746_23020, partial [Isosphaeraceae bacterium]